MAANTLTVPDGASMRPRANTISHVDRTTLGMMAAANSSVARQRRINLTANNQPSLEGRRGPEGVDFRDMSSTLGHHETLHGHLKIDTQGLNIDLGGGLRTAPVLGRFETNHSTNHLVFASDNTVNPQQLHFSESPTSLAFDVPASPFSYDFSGMPSALAFMDEDNNHEWMNGFEHPMIFPSGNDNPIAASSPSAISTGSPSGISEVMLDGSSNPTQSNLWSTPMLSQPLAALDYAVDVSSSAFPDLLSRVPLSSEPVQEHLGGSEDRYPAGPPGHRAAIPVTSMSGLPTYFFHPPMAYSSETPSTSTASVSSSNHQSSVSSTVTSSITDATRQAITASLSQPSTFSHTHRKYFQPPISSPLSPGFSATHGSLVSVVLPSTYDLQRYVTAYIQCFHPHLPFLHLPTLSFDPYAFLALGQPGNGSVIYHPSGTPGDGGCLILAMAAIGALYEYDNNVSKDLFEQANRSIEFHHEERRKVDVSTTVNGGNPDDAGQNTPVWLLQAMLLNVIYGHNCGDKTAADIASTHCAALVTWARTAELFPQSNAQSDLGLAPKQGGFVPDDDVGMSNSCWNQNVTPRRFDERHQWYVWRAAEERKRMLYAVFILSSMLVSAYNRAPVLMNSDISLDLPCDDDLWAAESPATWFALGGDATAEQRAIPFSLALSSLLSASQRHQTHSRHPKHVSSLSFGTSTVVSDMPASEFQCNTFGCLVLINALHNSIWETRQRQLGRQWSTPETEALLALMEPALAAWQAAWASNPVHSLERPNPFGLGPLSADCIPMLDLAYVRLFVDIGRSKEEFWPREFDAMADKLATHTDAMLRTELPPIVDSHGTSTSTRQQGSAPVTGGSYSHMNSSVSPQASHHRQSSEQWPRHERHLQKAAFYAARSLSLSDQHGGTFSDFNSRQLPLSSALCAFDCAQVLAEWVSIVQERVGRYLGILGKDHVDFTEIPGMMYVEQSDVELLAKIDEVLANAETKMAIDDTTAKTKESRLDDLDDYGYGSKILLLTARMLERAAVWPGISR